MMKSEKKNRVVLRVKNLKTYYPILGGLFRRTIGYVKAVDGVTFNLYKQETLGLVGESGCGKTSIGNTILNIVPATSGEITYENRVIVSGSDQKKERILHLRNESSFKHIIFIPIYRFLSGLINYLKPGIKKIYRITRDYLARKYPSLKNMFIEITSIFKQNYRNYLKIERPYNKDLHKKIQVVFQDPDASLNPRWRVVNIIGEPLRILVKMRKRKNIRKRVLEVLETVSMKLEHLDRYPHEFSGGQKQRIVIARALACNPEIIILDEPTSALDVSVQAQILNLLKKLQKKFNLSFLFITHDLSVIQHIADRIAVMYLGKFVETGTIEEVFYNPTHPYTKALLSARPTFDPSSKRSRIILKGDVPSPINPPIGCPFNPRCQEKDKHVGCGIDQPRKIHLGGEHYMYCLPLKEEKPSYEGREFISDTWQT
ncbi:MAG: oligopeptide/dipeptide ABC transporter ATP-binding protein [Candidatus Hermodarchaeota archaeon]